MLNKRRLQDIDAPDLEALLANQTHESRTLDYKRDLSLSNSDDTKELARDVSSMANAAGGDLVYGIEEARDADKKNLGYPSKLLGVECPNFDATVLRFENIVRDTIDPRVQGLTFHQVEGFERGPIIIVRVPKSWSAPHMVSLGSQTHFYTRNNAGKHPLDVREIRAAFLAGTEQAARVRRFRDERLGRIIADETPVPLRSGESRLVTHVVPLANEELSIDIAAIDANAGLMPPPDHSSGWSSRLNLDGIVTYAGPSNDVQRTYAQAFRDGRFEGVTTGYDYPEGPKKPRGIWAFAMEKSVVEAVGTFLKILRSNGYEGPTTVMVTVLGVLGARIYVPGRSPFDELVTIDRDTLLLPDVLVENLTSDPRVFMRPTFDALWNASGWRRSFGYDDAGKWLTDRHS